MQATDVSFVSSGVRCAGEPRQLLSIRRQQQDHAAAETGAPGVAGARTA